LNLLDLNAVYYKEQYEEELIQRYLIVLMFSVILGLFLGKVFVERRKEYLKSVVSAEQELSYLGLPIVLECFKRSLERGWAK
jgi:ABC-type phosphate transport system permease subunit